mgnify:CR=1 FL=1
MEGVETMVNGIIGVDMSYKDENDSDAFQNVEEINATQWAIQCFEKILFSFSDIWHHLYTHIKIIIVQTLFSQHHQKDAH